MEPLKKMSIHFTCEEEHLIMSCKEDGSFQSMWRLGISAGLTAAAARECFRRVTVPEEMKNDVSVCTRLSIRLI